MIQKAGGIITKKTPEGVRILCIHRARYDDWSFPKGHVEVGESVEDTAVREVLEETGFQCEIVRSLPDMVYTLPDGKECRVALFEMHVLGENPSAKDTECDEMRWCTVEECVEKVSYDTVRDYLRSIMRV